MTQVPADDPLMIAWTAYKQTEEFANSMKWTAHPEHVLGSMWAMFVAGYNAKQPHEPRAEHADQMNGKGSVTLSAAMLKEALEYIAPDDEAAQMECEAHITWCRDGHSGPGYYCWDAEYPEEGSIILGPQLEQPETKGRCQHDLQKPDHTMTVTHDMRNGREFDSTAQCNVCGEGFMHPLHSSLNGTATTKGADPAGTWSDGGKTWTGQPENAK